MFARIRLFVGWALLVVGYIFWNASVAGPAGFNRYGDPVDGWGEFPFLGLIVLMALWYVVSMINIVNEWDRRPVLRFGKYTRTLEPGITLVDPIFNNILPDISLQDEVIPIEVKHTQTKDNVGIAVTGLLTYRIDKERVRDAVVMIYDVDGGTEERAMSTLVDVVGTEDLDHLLAQRETFCTNIQTKLGKRVEPWGVRVVAFELKSLSINDPDVEKAIAMKARAAKEGEAELTRAHKQQEIAKALDEAAKAYTADGKWLKGMEVLVELGRSANNNTILIPTDLTEALAKMSTLFGK